MEKNEHNLNEDYLNSLPEEQRIAEMEQWTPEEVAEYLCPEGTMTIEEFDKLLTERITELWNERYGRDHQSNSSK